MIRAKTTLLATILLVVPSLAASCPSATPEPRDADTAEAPPGPRDATLLLMADIRGVLRPCGCTVDLQKGGFDRLVPYLATERARYPGAALLHAGPIFFEEGAVQPDKVAQRARQSEVAADLVARAGFDIAAATAADAAASAGKVKALRVRPGISGPDDQGGGPLSGSAEAQSDRASYKLPPGRSVGRIRRSDGSLVLGRTLGERAHLTMTAANLTLAAGPAVSPYEVRAVGGVRVGVFALASPEEAEHLGAGGTIEDPAAAAERTVAALKGRADVVVLLSALGLRHTKRLVRKVSGIDFAVVGGMGEHPSVSDEAELVGATRVMQFHREGRFIGRLALHVVGAGAFVDASQASPEEIAALDARITLLKKSLADWQANGGGSERELRSAKHHLASLEDERDKLASRTVAVPRDKNSFSFTLTPLNWDLPQDPDVLAIMTAFEKELAQISVNNAGTLPEAKEGEAYYVGATACFDCHEGPERFWKSDRHHRAWKTLQEDHKTFDAECVSCHVTGYKQPGGSLVGHTKGRKAVQCEACHGPGSAHIKDTKNPALINGHPTAEVCQGCHNHHHSPSFDFAVYKPKLMVRGHGLPPLPEDLDDEE